MLIGASLSKTPRDGNTLHAEEWDGGVWMGVERDPAGYIEVLHPYRPYTASLDAALALVERCLPDAYRDLGEGYDTKAQRRFWLATLTYHTPGRGSHSAEAPTAPLALICALLVAMEGNEG